MTIDPPTSAAETAGAGARRGLSLGARIFLAIALLVIATVGGAVALTFFVGQGIAEQAARDTLSRTAAVQTAFQEQQLERLRLIARILVSDPPFVAYVAETLDSGDTLSLLDQLDERQRDLGSDFTIVLDPDGRLAAATGPFVQPGTDFSTEPLVEQALERFEAVGVWARDGQLFYAVAVPIVQVDVLYGFLIAGVAIDDAAALELRRIGEADVAFFAVDDDGRTMVASTLEVARAEALTEALRTRPAGAAGISRLELGGEPWLALAQPLLDAGGATVGGALTLASVAAQREPFERIGASLIGIGLGAVLLALLVSFLLPRRLLRPVRKLASAAQAAAAGDYDQRIDTRRGDEVGRLGRAFDTLLAELREKRDMELYIGELAKSLPETAAVAAPTAAPGALEDRVVTVLGVDLRTPEGAAPPAAATLAELTAETRRLAAAVAAQGGAVEAVVGRRLLASFAGERRMNRALAAAHAIAAAGAEGGVPPAQALASGRLVAGEVIWGRQARRALAGDALAALENLLRIAKPGDLLVSRTAYDELGEVYRHAGEKLENEPGFAATLPLFALEVRTATRLTGLDPQQTWDARPGDLGGTVASGSLANGGLANVTGGVVPGQVIGERFEILATLGSGGMGVVYKANDRKLDELVAVKMLKTASVDDEQLSRLKRELKLARKISHPNVLRTFDFGEVEGMPFITMEYVRGITLRQLLDKSGRLPLSAGLHLARQLCRGLEVAHGEGVLHRDIKPENLIVEPTGNVKLMDFGIARPLRHHQGETSPGAIIGTPFYLAPEQLQGQEPDPRADIYACGVVFYEIFTGELPFPASGSIVDVLNRKLEQDPVPPSQRWPEMPAALEAIVLRCLARPRDERYDDVHTLRRELEAIRA